MRKLQGLVALTAVLCSLVNVPQEDVIEEVEQIEAVETVELPQIEKTEYLTEQDFSLLYTCKEYEAPINTDIVEISYEDAQLLMKIAKAEDATDAQTQAYIMSVILNRVNSEDFPNTIAEVINQVGQFSPIDDKRFSSAIPDLNSHEALFLVESGQVQTDFLYFEALTAKGTWQSTHRQIACECGATRFYY